MQRRSIVRQMQDGSHRITHRDADVDTGNRNIYSREYRTASLYHNKVDIAEYPPPRVVQDPMQRTYQTNQYFPRNYAPTEKQE